VTWKNTSIKRIGQTIAARYGLGFTYDAEDYDIECDEQDGADSSYYNTLCQNYGLVLKVYARRLVGLRPGRHTRQSGRCGTSRTTTHRGTTRACRLPLPPSDRPTGRTPYTDRRRRTTEYTTLRVRRDGVRAGPTAD